jgi:hypothetical protein
VVPVALQVAVRRRHSARDVVRRQPCPQQLAFQPLQPLKVLQV